jgi:SAM-dependent methyltransferase
VSLIDRLHERRVHARRVRRLAELLAELIPQNFSVLDVGCGDGRLDKLLLQRRPDLRIQGVEVSTRPQESFPITYFDGKTLPFPDQSFDAVMFVDVLHHTDDPMVLLREAARVARQQIILKDHTKQGIFAGARLRFMDYVGNAHHGVALPFNYWTPQQWGEAEGRLGLARQKEIKRLHLYPWPADYVFGANLHFIARYGLSRS